MVAGSATIEDIEGEVTGVDQTSDSAIVEWDSFDIAAGDSFFFNQPNSDAVILNRVLGPGASMINGAIDANGNVFIINGDGVIFGAGAVIDVNGLLVTTTDIAKRRFHGGEF